jgi:hypothetical protein
VALVLLAGCTATTGGTGHVAVSAVAGPPATTSPTTSPTHTPPYQLPAGVPGSVLRGDDSSIVEDPITADLCAGIRPSTFRRWGSAYEHWFQSAGRCYYDVDTGGGAWFQLDTALVFEQDFDMSGARRRIVQPGGETVFSFPVRGDNCERAFLAGGYVIETSTFAAGAVPRQSLCGAADAWLRAAIPAYVDSVVARRSLAHPSLTRFDICALVNVSKLEFLTDMVGLRDGLVDQGGACGGSASSFSLQVQVVFLDVGQTPAGTMIDVGGQQLRRFVTAVDQRPMCELMSQQGLTADGKAHEALDVQFTSIAGPSAQETCSVATEATLALLRTAGLR